MHQDHQANKIQNTKEVISSLIAIFILILVIVFSAGFFVYLTHYFENKRTCENQTINPPECSICPKDKVLVDNKCIDNINIIDKKLTDFEKYESYQKVSIYPAGIETPSNYNEKTAWESFKNASREITIKGEIEDAYIYIKAGSTNEEGKYSSITEKWETIWFSLRDNRDSDEDSGHLDLSKSRLGKTSDLTELLYNLSEVSLARSTPLYREGKFITINFLDKLKEGTKFTGALVSTMGYGKIENLIIAYKCKEASPNCKIE